MPYRYSDGSEVQKGDVVFWSVYANPEIDALPRKLVCLGPRKETDFSQGEDDSRWLLCRAGEEQKLESLMSFDPNAQAPASFRAKQEACLVSAQNLRAMAEKLEQEAAKEKD